MKYFESVLAFLMAAFAIYMGIAAENFYPGRIGRKSTGGKPLPKWFGRLWCFVFAAIAIYMGTRRLR
jgi:hypothetical protein